MNVIYQPKGAALEYSPLACNLWTTCSHGCTYCYAPSALQKKKEEFFIEAPERKNILANLEKDCQKMQGDQRPVLLSFVCDCYQPHDEKRAITREALLILEKYHMKAQILTKGGLRAERDFDILKRNNWKFGTTITYNNAFDSRTNEPLAASPFQRESAILSAHNMGIYTWVSIEPVIDPIQSLDQIERMLRFVDFWKIGKLNHSKELELKVDWKKFLRDVRLLLKDKQHYIKTDLLVWE